MQVTKFKPNSIQSNPHSTQPVEQRYIFAQTIKTIPDLSNLFFISIPIMLIVMVIIVSKFTFLYVFIYKPNEVTMITTISKTIRITIIK